MGKYVWEEDTCNFNGCNQREAVVRKRFSALLGDVDSFPSLIDESLRCCHTGVAYLCETCLNQAKEPPFCWAADDDVCLSVKRAYEH